MIGVVFKTKFGLNSVYGNVSNYINELCRYLSH